MKTNRYAGRPIKLLKLSSAMLRRVRTSVAVAEQPFVVPVAVAPAAANLRRRTKRMSRPLCTRLLYERLHHRFARASLRIQSLQFALRVQPGYSRPEQTLFSGVHAASECNIRH